jgi:two-component system, NarL family, sensor histidine kinase DegS
VKHSGERHFTVDLQVKSGNIRMAVSDPGVGFVLQDTVNLHGLGLISMKERLQMVNGESSIKSAPGSGTTVQALVPLSSSEFPEVGLDSPNRRIQTI